MDEHPTFFRIFGEAVPRSALDMVRLARCAEELNLSAAVAEEIRKAVVEAMEGCTASPKQSDLVAGSVPQAQSPRSVQGGVAQLDLRLRQLVEKNATWTEVEGVAWALFHASPGAERAARLVELAYLHGSISEVVVAMQTMQRCQFKFFSHLHPTLRCTLGLRLWQKGETELLHAAMATLASEEERLPSEHLFCFWQGMHGHDPTIPFVYFQRFEEPLLKGAAQYGSQVGFSCSRFCYLVGKLAIDLGFDTTARRILEKIDRDAEEYGGALELLLRVKVEKNGEGHSTYQSRILAEKDWRERIRLLRGYLNDAQRLGAFRDRHRAALNDLLKDPLQWLPAQPAAWQALSSLLTEFAAIVHQLPCLFDCYRANALVFHRPEIDLALWEPPLQELTAAHGQANYWRGVALLHYFLAKGPQYEASLWEAKEAVTRCQETPQFAVAFAWTTLHKAAMQFVHKTLHLHEQDRMMMLRQLKVANDPRLLALNDVQEYLDSCRHPNYTVLENLQYLARQHQQPNIELNVLRRRVQIAHLTNRDLDRLWQLGVETADFDLSWRTASVAHARKGLKKTVLHAWQISGEKRSDYPFMTIGRADLERCMMGLSADGRRFADACTKIGPLLPELLACLDAGARPLKPATPPADSPASRVNSCLAKHPWLPAPRRVFQFSHERLVDSQAQIPHFISVLPNNTWSYLIVQLSQRLGIAAWGWKVSHLHRQIEDLIPRLASRQTLLRHSAKVARWLRQLTPQQRSAWQDIAQLSGKMKDHEVSDCLARFLIRMAILIYPHHIQALDSLQAMRVDLPLLWDAEAWIVSEPYSLFRIERNLTNRVSVPKSLRRLDSIVGADVE